MFCTLVILFVSVVLFPMYVLKTQNTHTKHANHHSLSSRLYNDKNINTLINTFTSLLSEYIKLHTQLLACVHTQQRCDVCVCVCVCLYLCVCGDRTCVCI